MHSTIMIVDDEPTVMEMARTQLEDANFSNFVLVQDSSIAMQKIEETNPDILLLDLSMPTVSGFDLIEQVRDHLEFRHLPIIVMTASSDRNDKIRALSLGATDFLAKPVDATELCLRVYNTLAAKAYQNELLLYDPLTDLPIRHVFLKRFDILLDKANKAGSQLAIMNIELDKFNRLYDSAGIRNGDQALLNTAMRLEKIAKKSIDQLELDNAEEFNIELFQIDNTSFALLVEPLKSPETAKTLAGLIVDQIKEPMEFNAQKVVFTASIGISIYPSSGIDQLALWRHAARAKNHAMKSGGDQFVLY